MLVARIKAPVPPSEKRIPPNVHRAENVAKKAIDSAIIFGLVKSLTAVGVASF